MPEASAPTANPTSTPMPVARQYSQFGLAEMERWRGRSTGSQHGHHGSDGRAGRQGEGHDNAAGGAAGEHHLTDALEYGLEHCLGIPVETRRGLDVKDGPQADGDDERARGFSRTAVGRDGVNIANGK